MTTIQLPADCNRSSAIELLGQLRAAPERVSTLDGGMVATIGQAMLQVLLAARRDDPSLAIVNPSPELQDVARLTGVSSALLGETAR